ncbi:2,3-dihydro-2,3-dihydroxybenzoate dehydrogenase [Thaumasiovibrio subtropicus]|uniref:2,3-dihydro-2,3-dihydroxybenzoate dehydrogenase n=1 Tax=Thaumasiovibrio subtropicus TaxID=1891207 RepID=UPI000B34F6A2|nr:2,3-dihydro-2,3-dihydroxybenzoate dehydrogenase [Thaumasiovibrio subtropicus]
MERSFRDAVVVVTGAAQGIGEAVVDALSAHSATVIALDIAFEASRLTQVKEGVWRAKLDVSNKGDVEHVIKQVLEQFGHIDGVVSVAGILHMHRLLEHPSEDWLQTFAVNCHGPFYLCQMAARAMVKRKRGAIVAVGSNAAKTPRLDMGSYCASKAALAALIKNLGLELAEYGIRCNLVSPGSTDTPMQRQLWMDDSGRERAIAGNLATHRLGIPLQRIASPQEIAEVVLFLLSDKAKHITMESVVIDGGATLGQA